MSPLVTPSSPAIIRNNVDLPQPEGPTSTTNSPCSIERPISFRIAEAPYDLLRFAMRTVAMAEPALFDSAGRQAADQLSGKDYVDDDDRQDRQRKRR